MNNNLEILFWKVFKNICLFRNIFKHIKSNQLFGIYSYYEIVRAEWMIENGYLELLREKVKRCEYLVFNCGFKHPSLARGCMRSDISIGTTENTFNFKNSIFNVFKDDYEFFSILLKNYSLYFQMPSSCKHIERISIELDNIAALKVIVDQYSFKPDIISFFNSYEIGSISVSQYLYELLFLNSNIKFTKVQIDSLWNLTFSNKITTTPLANIRVLTTNVINDKELCSNIIIKKLFFIVNVLNLKPNISNLKPLESLFNFKIYNKPLSKLLICSKVVSILSKFKSFHQVFDSQFSKEKTFISDINIKVSLKTHENSLLIPFLNLTNDTKTTKSNKIEDKISEPKNLPNKTSVLTSQTKKISTPLELESTTLFNQINNMKFTKGELKSHVRSLIEISSLSLPITAATTIENIKKLYEMLIKFTTFGKNNLVDNFSFFRIKFYNESFPKLELFKSFSNRSIKEFIRNDKIEIIEKLCIGKKMVVNEETSPYYNMKSIQMLDLIYKYDKQKDDSIFLLLFYNYKIANHFKLNYNKHYQTIISSRRYPTQLKDFSFERYSFIFENWSDFTAGFKEKILCHLTWQISLSKIPLVDYIRIIKVLNLYYNYSNKNTNAPFYKSSTLYTNSLENMEFDIFAFEQLSYLIDKNYCHLENEFGPPQQIAPVLCTYYLRGELDKIDDKFRTNQYYLTLVAKEIAKKADIKSFQCLILCEKGRKDFIQSVLSKSLFYGTFEIFHKSLNSNQVFSTSNLISESIEHGQIESLLYLKKHFNYYLNQPLKKISNDNNCFFLNYIKNLNLTVA
ncbi:hypothetical protein RB653_006634 [Dictyostelium firmibasis]|uniref:Uncharacterized protein n=1 Tax=Dictyostelium firmibasis TaxID=79012 RepID=A0AAN7TTB5_9MYCE